ncbi:T9SS type A sorting domain-containing protein [candidate division KSB1 bacterium]|nr:T9SS type A sorting domain-containing protein [candidate division KSB1 bacterium]NIR71506.1 T9SS type A sorting domain-containing protein [candidate division KSB1 bacterium]NIT73089.1 T9SS type A sorting domain-containing protein [candidate division KSB1 bacterium]NIU26998.1 T9SS type A sorting domain-containing protein [candidate division KSB1 bacterium]NIU92646.1 T9SS type A sorting domain-containing protein [candidate division KSB1 bacterium]
MHQNYPNPFNPTTEIKFGLPQPGEVTLSIFNIVGQKVRSLLNGPKTAGYHSVIWDGRNDFGNQVVSGVYVYRIRVLPNGAENELIELAKKMTLVR